MKYKITLNNRVYEVEVEAGQAMLLSEYKSFGKREVFVADNGFSHHIKLRCQLITADIGTVHFISPAELSGLYKINTDND